jgi:hypothetical protein
MAIQTSPVNTANTTLYTSVGKSAVTMLSFCNYSGSTVTLQIHIVPDGDGATNDNIFIADLEIVAGDTFIAYQGNEKFVLGDGDSIQAFCSTASSLSAITSYVTIG